MMCLEGTWFVAAFRSTPMHDPGLKEVVCKGASALPCLLRACCVLNGPLRRQAAQRGPRHVPLKSPLRVGSCDLILDRSRMLVGLQSPAACATRAGGNSDPNSENYDLFHARSPDTRTRCSHPFVAGEPTCRPLPPHHHTHISHSVVLLLKAGLVRGILDGWVPRRLELLPRELHPVHDALEPLVLFELLVRATAGAHADGGL